MINNGMVKRDLRVEKNRREEGFDKSEETITRLNRCAKVTRCGQGWENGGYVYLEWDAGEGSDLPFPVNAARQMLASVPTPRLIARLVQVISTAERVRSPRVSVSDSIQVDFILSIETIGKLSFEHASATRLILFRNRPQRFR